MTRRYLAPLFLLALIVASVPAHAFFFIIPIPNVAKPAPLSTLIDALEKSEETKAIAYVSEDKTFGSKYWVWGSHSGHVPQEEADRQAMVKCLASLERAKAQSAGGKSLYDFGTKTCELYSFANKTVSPRAHEWNPAPPPAVTAPVSPMPPPAPASSAEQAPLPQKSAATESLPDSKAPTYLTLPSEPPSTTAQPTSTRPQTSTSEGVTARKLRELESLRKERLITETEYNEKRKAILSAM